MDDELAVEAAEAGLQQLEGGGCLGVALRRGRIRAQPGHLADQVRFVETLGTSVAAAAFAALFAARTGGSLAGAGHLMVTLEIIFAIGAILLALATVIGLRLPSGPVLQQSGAERADAERSDAERPGAERSGV